MSNKKKPKYPRGSSVWGAHLTEDDVFNIKQDLALGEMKQNDIAKKYDVSASTISRIKTRKVWKHVAGASKKVALMKKYRRENGVNG
jgi:uncharacterized protein YjcR